MRLRYYILPVITGFLFFNANAQTKKLITEGNLLYGEKKYKDAAETYQKALIKNPNDTVSLFNLGNSLYQQKQYDAARKAMYETANKVKQKDARGAAIYNMGNTYLAERKWEDAVTAYKQALKNNPQDADAKYNLSYAREMLKTDPSKSKSKFKSKTKEIEPSAYAKKLKQQAETQIAQRQYNDALHLMQDGLKKDSTVKVFNDFIKRIKDVTEIDNKK